jgi:hypothetical protein
MNVMTPPRYLLSSHAFVCLTDDIFVFLDLKNDQYSCLERQHTQGFAKIMGLLDALPQAEREPPVEASELRGIITDLETRGLVTRDPAAGRCAALIPEPTQLKELSGYAIGEVPKIRAGHVISFFRALITVKTMLRFASMERIITRVKRRKLRQAQTRETDPAKIAEMVEIYKILKPLFVTVKDQCLYNSFFLIEFLARYRIYPSWYFGVRLNQFYAHCWVQDGDTLYDDFVQSVCQNRPIMKV